MKRMMIVPVAALALVCLLTGCCTYTPQTKTETNVIPCSRGETLHVDALVRSGMIDIQVTAPDGKICFEKELSNSFDCGINIYSPGNYTVTERWKNARGDVTIYQTVTIEKDFE